MSEDDWTPYWQPFSTPNSPNFGGVWPPRRLSEISELDQSASEAVPTQCDLTALTAQEYAATGAMSEKCYDPRSEPAWTGISISAGSAIGPELERMGQWDAYTQGLAVGMPSEPRGQLIQELYSFIPVRSSLQNIHDSVSKSNWPDVYREATSDRDQGIIVSPDTNVYCATAEGHMYILTRHPTQCSRNVCRQAFEKLQVFDRDSDGGTVHGSDAAAPHLTDMNTHKHLCDACERPAWGEMLLHPTGLGHYHNVALTGTPGVVRCRGRSHTRPITDSREVRCAPPAITCKYEPIAREVSPIANT